MHFFQSKTDSGVLYFYCGEALTHVWTSTVYSLRIDFHTYDVEAMPVEADSLIFLMIEAIDDIRYSASFLVF